MVDNSTCNNCVHTYLFILSIITVTVSSCGIIIFFSYNNVENKSEFLRTILQQREGLRKWISEKKCYN